MDSGQFALIFWMRPRPTEILGPVLWKVLYLWEIKESKFRSAHLLIICDLTSISEFSKTLFWGSLVPKNRRVPKIRNRSLDRSFITCLISSTTFQDPSQLLLVLAPIWGVLSLFASGCLDRLFVKRNGRIEFSWRRLRRLCLLVGRWGRIPGFAVDSGQWTVRIDFLNAFKTHQNLRAWPSDETFCTFEKSKNRSFEVLICW